LCLEDGRERVIGVTTDRPRATCTRRWSSSPKVNNLLAQQVGLAKADLPPRFVALSVKELINTVAQGDWLALGWPAPSGD
jgi:electron transfer flavoprotein-quinone oxidoreductase